MKKKSQAIKIFIFLTTALILSCNEKPLDKEKISITAEKLAQNENFLNISNEMNSYSQFIIEKIKNNKLPPSEIFYKIDSISNSGLSNNEQITQLSLLLETDVSERIKQNDIIIDFNWKMLDSEFDNLNLELLTDAFNFSKKNQTYSRVKGSCGWRYSVCLGAAYAGAVLCHAGCDTTALATTAGLGIPACVAACGTLQIFASVQCYDSYCPNELVEKKQLKQ